MPRTKNDSRQIFILQLFPLLEPSFSRPLFKILHKMSNSKKALLSRFQTMGNLASPIRSKLFNRYGNEHYKVSVCAMQGYRASMEDAHSVCLSFDDHPGYSLFGIFDGHNGRRASHHLEQHLVSRLNQLPSLDDDEDIQNVVLSMDEEFCKSPDGANGSTVVFAIVRPIPPSNCDLHILSLSLSLSAQWTVPGLFRNSVPFD